MFQIDRATKRLFDDQGRVFDGKQRLWQQAEAVEGGEALGLRQAVAWLQKESGTPYPPPVGVIGAREATAEAMALAEALGRGLGEMGLVLICGGRGGVMEAACKGASEAGGVAIGVLPDEDWQLANPYVTIPLATGIGEARNAIIARAAFCLAAVSGGYGTHSEMALGLKFGKRVYALGDAPNLADTIRGNSVDAVLDGIARKVLALD